MTANEERVRESFSRQNFMSVLGAELTTVGQGHVEIRLPFSSKLTQQNGYLHAGAVTAVLDSACGYAALTVAADDKEVLSVEFKVNLLTPAVGEFFKATAQVKRAGRSLIVCTADALAVSGGAEKAVATMLATIMAVPFSPAA
jgi:uncharacterized protein (TIGR00369 family)